MQGCQSINEFHHLRALDRRLVQGMYERVGGIVERAEDVYALARTAGISAMWHAKRRPCTLHIWYGRHSRLIKKIEVSNAILGGDLQPLQNDPLFYELLFWALFFRDRRQRL